MYKFKENYIKWAGGPLQYTTNGVLVNISALDVNNYKVTLPIHYFAPDLIENTVLDICYRFKDMRDKKK